MFRLSRVFCNGTNLNNYVKNSCRTLYSLSSMGVDGYASQREKTQQYLLNNADKFREKMKAFVDDDQTSMVFTEDLKNMIHLADASDNDLQLVEDMLRKFNKQNKSIRFGNYIFGPVVMRYFYHINKPDVALKLFKDADFEGFFDQLSSYQILVDMLYEQDRYQDVVDVFQVIRSRQIQGGMYPRHVVLLVFAACYKENTPESFKFATELWSELNNVGHIPMRRAITLAAALAIRQNAPDVALEIVGTSPYQHYVTVRNIKVLAFTNLGRPDDALPILKSVLQVTDTTNKHSFSKDVIAVVREAVNKSGDKELVQNYERLEKFLIENGHVDDQTLEELLTKEIDTSTPQNDNRKDRSVLAASYNHNNSYNKNNNRNYNQNNNNRNNRNQNDGFKRSSQSGGTGRPGLEDLY